MWLSYSVLRGRYRFTLANSSKTLMEFKKKKRFFARVFDTAKSISKYTFRIFL